MANDQAWVWLRQAASDYLAASNCCKSSDATTFCHAIAKYQQTVEKSVKAIAAALKDRGRWTVPIAFKHDVQKLVSSMIRLRHTLLDKGVHSSIRGLFHPGNFHEIEVICSLAPEKPGPGQLARRNTEYPYQNADGSWRAPGDVGSFFAKEVDRFNKLAHRILEGSTGIVSALYR